MTQQYAATALMQAALRQRLLSMKEALSLRHVLAGCGSDPQAIRARLAHNPEQVSAVTLQALRDLLPTTAQEKCGDYQRLALLGRGASGQTWLGIGPSGLVVLKTLEASLITSHDTLSSALAPLLGGNHLYLINYLAVISDIDGTTTLVEQYRPGRDIAERQVVKGEASEARALTILRHAAKGLAQLHHLDCIHGNLKPSNLLLDSDGRVALSDFACAATSQGIRPGWTPLRLHNTPFAAPETTSSSPSAGPASDIYSLGCIGYWLLCGHTPFPSAPDQQALQHAKAKRPDVRALAPGVSELTAKTLLKAMHIDPATRYANARALVHSLERNLDHLQRPQSDTDKQVLTEAGASSLMLEEPE
jgi:eukaryotic-like serine/threonine-protein kinase